MAEMHPPITLSDTADDISHLLGRSFSRIGARATADGYSTQEAIEVGLISVLGHVLMLQREEPELAEWIRYHFLADVPDDLQRRQAQSLATALRKIRAEREPA